MEAQILGQVSEDPPLQLADQREEEYAAADTGTPMIAASTRRAT